MTQIPEEISPIKIVNEYLTFKKVIGTSKATLEALEDFALYVVCKHIPASLHPSTEWVSVGDVKLWVELVERFMPKEVAADNKKEMAMYELYHRMKEILPAPPSK